jgi:hypothetical protein
MNQAEIDLETGREFGKTVAVPTESGVTAGLPGSDQNKAGGHRPPEDDTEPDIAGRVNPRNAPAVPRDNYGREFDPRLHVVNPDGTPKLTRNGFLRCKMRAAPAATPTAEEPAAGDGTPLVAAMITASENATAMATLAFGLMDVYGCKLFGEKWKATDAEREQLVGAWAMYITYKGWDKPLTPELAVLAATAMFMIPRIDIVADRLLKPKAKPVVSRVTEAGRA